MTGAALLLLVNVAVTGFFAAAFVAVTLMASGERSTLWFAGAYGIGLLTPLSEFLLPLSPSPGALALTSYASFLGGPLLIPIGLAALHGERRPWRAFLVIFLSGLLLRIGIWNGVRNTFAYDLAYQLPFALSAMLASRSAAGPGPRGALQVALGWLFVVIAAQFLLKPFLIVALGSGRSASDYVHSRYAVFSQASTAVLLVAAGLLILLLVVQKTLSASKHASETDDLSMLGNRRGFDRRARALVARAGEEQMLLCAVMFDLDHFKRINDNHGHATGDALIAAFGELLKLSVPPDAITGRVGGEEFALLIPGCTADAAWLKAEAIRVGLGCGQGDLPKATVSGGVAQWRRGDTLEALMRRADTACYAAKRSGRNRVCVDPLPTGMPVSSDISQLAIAS